MRKKHFGLGPQNKLITFIELMAFFLALSQWIERADLLILARSIFLLIVGLAIMMLWVAVDLRR